MENCSELNMKANKRSLSEKITSKNLTLKPQDNIKLAKLCGTLDENLSKLNLICRSKYRIEAITSLSRAPRKVFSKHQN